MKRGKEAKLARGIFMATVSLIIPLYNEKGTVDRTFATVAAFAQAHPDWEFIFVDDGSVDGTSMCLAQALQQAPQPNVRLVPLPINRGKGHAIRHGFSISQGRFFCFTDGDLAYSLDQVERLHENLEAGADIVIGSRKLPSAVNVVKPRRRQILGGLFNLFVRLVLGLRYRDTQAGLKGFHREAAVPIFDRLRVFGFAFDVEVLYLAEKFGFQVLEIPACVGPEHTYKTSKLNLIRDSLRMFREVLWIRLNNVREKYHFHPADGVPVKSSS